MESQCDDYQLSLSLSKYSYILLFFLHFVSSTCLYLVYLSFQSTFVFLLPVLLVMRFNLARKINTSAPEQDRYRRRRFHVAFQIIHV